MLMTEVATPLDERRAAAAGTKHRPAWELPVVGLVVGLPPASLLVAIPLAWGHGVRALDLVLVAVFYVATGLGITVGFHRMFTHGSFAANRPLKIALAVAGSMAMQGPVIRWVADHRKHHAYADADGDPHSPWRYGESVTGLLRGFFHAHMGWLFEREQASTRRWAPDLVADRDLVWIHRLFPVIALASLGLPALIGGLVTLSWAGAATGLLWGGFVRIFLIHHVTWSVNSICHIVGERPFETRDKATNFWPLAIFSFGESWHNLHHADPKCARHGVDRGQLDPSARVIRWFEQAGWAMNVRWPEAQRIDRRRKAA
jgi:stearoyl-CoA desaturase (delta-9 desaturase)